MARRCRRLRPLKRGWGRCGGQNVQRWTWLSWRYRWAVGTRLLFGGCWRCGVMTSGVGCLTTPANATPANATPPCSAVDSRAQLQNLIFGFLHAQWLLQGDYDEDRCRRIGNEHVRSGVCCAVLAANGPVTACSWAVLSAPAPSSACSPTHGCSPTSFASGGGAAELHKLEAPSYCAEQPTAAHEYRWWRRCASCASMRKRSTASG